MEGVNVMPVDDTRDFEISLTEDEPTWWEEFVAWWNNLPLWQKAIVVGTGGLAGAGGFYYYYTEQEHGGRTT